jgi:O-antigen/teichoic acid export membrane protein
VIEILQANFPQYAVSHRFDAATFAVYSVGCLQIPLVDFVAAPAANVMMVRMSENIQGGLAGSVLELWHDTTRKLALLFFPLFALVLVAAREIVVLLFTENYLASVPIFMVWSTTLLLAVLQVDSVLRVYARTRFIFLLNVVRLLLMVALIQWLLSTFYLVGAVLATVLALGVGKGMALFRMRSLMNARFSQLLPWRSLGGIMAVTAAAGMVALFVKSELSLSTLPLLLATGVIFAVSYGALVFVFGLLSDSERLALMGWLQRPPMGAAKV